MSAITETAGTRRDYMLGQQRVVKVDVTNVQDTFTWSPGLSVVEMFMITGSAAGATTEIGATRTSPSTKQAVVTFAVESGTLAGTVMAIGI